MIAYPSLRGASPRATWQSQVSHCEESRHGGTTWQSVQHRDCFAALAMTKILRAIRHCEERVRERRGNLKSVIARSESASDVAISSPSLRVVTKLRLDDVAICPTQRLLRCAHNDEGIKIAPPLILRGGLGVGLKYAFVVAALALTFSLAVSVQAAEPSSPPASVTPAPAKLPDLFKQYTYNDPLGGVSVPELVARLISRLLPLVGAAFLCMFIWGGLLYLTAGGDPTKVKKARDTLLNAGIGILIVVGAYAIVSSLINILGAGLSR